MKESYIKVIYPMLERLGLMWASDTIRPVHEHFISNIIRQKLLKSIDSLPNVNSSFGGKTIGYVFDMGLSWYWIFRNLLIMVRNKMNWV